MRRAAVAALLLLCAPSLAGAQQLGASTALDPELTAFQNGREYVFSTLNGGSTAALGLTVAANNFLNVRICNTSTTRTWFFGGNGPAGAGRFFDSTSTSVTPYYGIANPDVLTSAQAATLSTGNTNPGTNLYPGKPTQSDVTFTFGVGSLMTVGGATPTPSAVGGIYPGVKNDLNHGRALPPGTCFGQALVGQSTSGALGTNATSIQLGYRAYLYYNP